EYAQLGGGDVAEDEPDHDGGEAGLLLRPHAVGGPRQEGRIGVLDLGERRAARGWGGLGRQHERDATLGADPVALGAVLGEERRGADLVDGPLEARLGAVV